MAKAVAIEGFNPKAMPGLHWVKSSESTPGTLDDCVGLAEAANNMVAIADTKDAGATPLVFRRSEIAALIEGAKAGNFDHLTV
ncbi:DUF397 domain-containing protein [Streptomyces sp. NBC_00829]|uniref:DUF397 domain-containing protein n=1 Tax=Streptomyces sp. NBC_00829 TaxID=2903679 RepID=UPI00386CA237|nr:DUF397 domain-containing protein [Streptomyces sp. NBC_00829]